ncbi:MAG: hypothetical protein O7H40_01925, partial [Gammaproteobacteria bacterium]|nr:hypothetical protein [Gammaproteobacteria bacterium]
MKSKFRLRANWFPIVVLPAPIGPTRNMRDSFLGVIEVLDPIRTLAGFSTQGHDAREFSAARYQVALDDTLAETQSTPRRRRERLSKKV